MGFKRTKENFTCEQCDERVSGDGYTNHCPNCLWSKHVDVEPGDRASDCGGMMKPVRLEKEGDLFDVVHVCEKCRHEKRNKLQKGDNFDTAVALHGTL